MYYTFVTLAFFISTSTTHASDIYNTSQACEEEKEELKALLNEIDTTDCEIKKTDNPNKVESSLLLTGILEGTCKHLCCPDLAANEYKSGESLRFFLEGNCGSVADAVVEINTIVEESTCLEVHHEIQATTLCSLFCYDFCSGEINECSICNCPGGQALNSDGDCVNCGATSELCCIPPAAPCDAEGDTCNSDGVCVAGGGGGPPEVDCSACRCEGGQVLNAEGECTSCGQNEDDLCCAPPATPCAAGLVCNKDGVCKICGTPPQQCCPGRKCNPDTVCQSDNTCTSCGGTGEICCDPPARACDSGFVCGDDNRCESCGNVDDQCCSPPATPCGGSRLVCNKSGLCRPCGAEDEQCCSTQKCAPDLVCRFDNLCKACGAENEFCCDPPASPCDPALFLICGDNNKCERCGNTNEPCCLPPSAPCRAAKACDRNGLCQDCGGLNAICCPAPAKTCAPGLICERDYKCRACGTSGLWCCPPPAPPCASSAACQLDGLCP